MALEITFEQVTDLSSVPTLTVPSGCHTLWIQVEAQNVRYRIDGGAPTDAIGHRLLATAENPTVINNSEAIGNLQIIEETPGGIANITYFASDT